MKRLFKPVMAFSLAALIGCVIIPSTFEANIRIEIRHIQEQAGGVLDYVEGTSDELPGLGVPSDSQTSMMLRGVRSLRFVSVAYAAELNDNTPRVKQIADSMKGRFTQVAALKKEGRVGENKRGMLEMVPGVRIADAEEKNEVQRVIAAENKDRKALYQEIARINRDQNLNVSTVESIYAQERLERARAGEHFQLPAAGGDFEAFKRSPAGQRLASKCVPGAWVRIE